MGKELGHLQKLISRKLLADKFVSFLEEVISFV